jgi:hypothetical protein
MHGVAPELITSPHKVLRSEKVADEKDEGDQQQASGAASD